MKAYYNEHDRSAAAWLRELIKEKVITDGIVDERSIEDVVPAELAEFDRCHFFAGIGVWDYALTRAGWPDDRRVWTGSCPCQPFSAAGKGDGFADERHLWPAWFHLIEQCRPGVIFGEQVSSKDTLPWIDLVHADLEGALYTVAAADLCSPSVGAPHIRQRLYFVAERVGVGLADTEGGERWRFSENDRNGGQRSMRNVIGPHSSTHELAKPVSVGRRGRSERSDEREIREGGRSEIQIEGPSEFSGSGFDGVIQDDAVGGRQQTGCDQQSEPQSLSGIIGSSVSVDLGVGLGDTERVGCGSRLDSGEGISDSRNGQESGQQREISRFGISERSGSPGPTDGFWRDAEWIYYRDGKWRPVGTIESGAFEMADGLAADLGCVRDQGSGRYTISPLIEKGKGRVSRLRGYGNAIVAEVAVAWIEAYLSNEND